MQAQDMFNRRKSVENCGSDASITFDFSTSNSAAGSIMADSTSGFDMSGFDMSIDLASALADENLSDPDVLGSLKCEKKMGPLGVAPGAARRKQLLPAASGRSSSRALGQSGFRSVGISTRRLSIIGEKSDQLENHDDGGEVLPPSPRIAELPRRSRPLLSAPSRRALLSRQPSITLRSPGISKLVQATTSQLDKLEAFLGTQDSQVIVFDDDDDDDMIDGNEDDDSLRDELMHLEDTEEEMRRELEGMWASGAIDGWKMEDHEMESGDYGGGKSRSEVVVEAEPSPSLPLSQPRPKEASWVSTDNGSDVSSIQDSAGTRGSGAAIAGGLSMARRKSSLALDLAGLEEFEARLEAEWEEALLMVTGDLGEQASSKAQKSGGTRRSSAAAEPPLTDDLDRASSEQSRVDLFSQLSQPDLAQTLSSAASDDGENGFLTPPGQLQRERRKWMRMPTIESADNSGVDGMTPAFTRDSESEYPALTETDGSHSIESASRSIETELRPDSLGGISNVLDSAEKVAGALFGRCGLRHATRSSKGSSGSVGVPMRTLQGAVVAYLALTSVGLRILFLHESMESQNVPVPTEVLWPSVAAATVVPAAAVALMEWSLPEGVEDVHVSAGVALVSLGVEHIIMN